MKPVWASIPISRRELWSIIQQQVVRQKVTVLLSTAYMDEAERCDHVILLHEGEILAQGNPAQLAAPLQGHAFVLENIPTAPRNLQSQIAQTARRSGYGNSGRWTAHRDAAA